MVVIVRRFNWGRLGRGQAHLSFSKSKAKLGRNPGASFSANRLASPFPGALALRTSGG